MRTRLAIAMVVILSVLLTACGPAADTRAVDSGAVARGEVGSSILSDAPASIQSLAAPGDRAAQGQMVLIAGTATPASTPSAGRGAGGSIKRPSDDPEVILSIRSHTAWVNDDGGINIVGEVVNVSDQVVDTMVTVVAALTDVDGNAVEGDFSAYLDRPVIQPGEVSSFWMPLYADEFGDVAAEDISDYELTLWISEDPSLEVELDVLWSEGAEDDGYFVITGEVENQTELSFDAVFVYSTLYDEDGEVVNATVDWAFPEDTLGPGDSMEFEGVFFDHFEDADSFYVFVTGYGWPGDDADATETVRLTSADGVFEVVSHTGFISDYGGINIVGEAENISDDTVSTLVVVEVVLYDEDGEPIGVTGRALLDRPAIEPGDTSSFWVPVYEEDLGDVDVDDIADYEILLWLSDRPSADVELTVTEADGGVEDDIFLIQGWVLNESDQDFDAITVYSTLYDEDGNVLNATLDWIGLDEPLAPGEEAEFEGYFYEQFEDADSFYVFVTGYDEAARDEYPADPIILKASDGILDFVSHSGFVTDYGAISIVGEAENISDRTLTGAVLVEVTVYDEDGEAIGTQPFTAYLHRPLLEPGDVSSFWVTILEEALDGFVADDVSDYEIELWLTEEPMRDTELEIMEAEGGEEGDVFLIQGTVYNQTDMDFSTLRVYSTLYDEDGAVINVTADWLDLEEPLAPGEEAEFEGYFDEHYEEADSYYVFVVGYEPPKADQESGLVSAEGIIEVTSHAGFTSEYGGLHVVGEALNVSDETIDTVVMVEVFLYNVDGNVIGDGEMTAYLDRPVIEPGQTSSFWVPIGADALGDYTEDDVYEYEVVLWVTDELSPDIELTVEEFDGGVEDGVFYVWGTVSNQTSYDIGGISVYSILYDENGDVVNATLDWIELEEALEPGDETEFEGYFPEHFEDAESFDVVVTGYTPEALGW